MNIIFRKRGRVIQGIKRIILGVIILSFFNSTAVPVSATTENNRNNQAFEVEDQDISTLDQTNTLSNYYQDIFELARSNTSIPSDNQ